MKRKRPILLSVIAVLQIIGGILLFLLIPFFFFIKDAMTEAMALFEIPFWFLVASAFFLAILNLAAGIGIWRKTKWGWWLTQFSFACDFFRRISAVLNIFSITGEMSSKMYMKTIGILANIFLIWYFFRPEILTYFNMQKVKKIKALLIIIGLNIALIIITTTITYLTYR